ncbi:uncharacterized protein LOC132732636 [Ruditapes philippinarum]|uniref:uncharacterized protein LOC132732636 n=1 Tax=Ruditapes philippinarum TaxID=129788 RepID=UPI00295AD9BB|nr:uncharacterized protein LOC132732636 [Ruditapes philippinarum]
MFLSLILFLISHTFATCDLLPRDADSPDRFILRKLLEDSTPNVTSNAITSANVTTTKKPLSTHRKSLAVLQVVDGQGLVQNRVSTNQNIRLRVKALTTPDYQPPFVKHCWYDQYTSVPSNDTEPSKTVDFLDNGCLTSDGKLLEEDVVPFMENGLLESQTDVFNLMSVYSDKFTFLGIHCEVVLCHLNEDCFVSCSRQKRKWRMDDQSESIQLAALLKVKKEKDAPTISPRKSAIHKEDDLDDFLIRGGRPVAPQFPMRRTEPPFLEKNHVYFTLSTLGVCALLLLCVIGAGCMYISFNNNREPTEQANTSGHVTSYPDNKMTGLPNVVGTSQKGVINNRDIVTSQPSEYNDVSAWPGADLNPRSPYREPAVLTPSEASVLEARGLLRSHQHSQRMPRPSQRRLALETDLRDEYVETRIGRANSRYSPLWNEIPEHYRDRTDITTSPVGGELYPGPSSRFRSPQSEPLIQKSPYRGRVKATSLLSMALNDYFDKYRM